MGFLTARVASADEHCTHTVNDIDDARAALNAAAPGDMLCFFGGDLANVDLTLTRSGTAQDPISLISDGHITVHQLHVLADHVVIQGFTIVGGGSWRRRTRFMTPSGAGSSALPAPTQSSNPTP
jgi:hypothetical protein